MDLIGELTFEGSIQHVIKKKTRRAKWKITMKQINATDASVKLNVLLDGKTTKSDVIVHNNSNKTIDIDGYVVINKKRQPITLKNVKLGEIAKNPMISLL